MIRIISGYTGPGGSTVAFCNLVNLLNKNGLEACLYGAINWKGINCKFAAPTTSSLKINKEDVVVFHFMKPTKIDCKKMILSCHETKLFPIKELKEKGELVYDDVHFVSEFQKNWHNVEGTVIPNSIRELDTPLEGRKSRAAGIIGSIDKNKRVHKSIANALKDGFTDIRIYGPLNDFPYFKEFVEPLLSDRVTYRGVSDDMNITYRDLTHVYHSPLLETFNMIKPECEVAGVAYVGDEGNDTRAESWSNDRILKAWEKLLV